MKILYYNWDTIDGSFGGVTVYQKNLLSEMIKRKDIDVYFINSGFQYDRKGLRIEQTTNSFGDAVKSYEIINSPVLAPVQESCRNLLLYLSDTKVSELFEKFLTENGPFDVVHFNNLEGLTIKVIELRQKFKYTKFIYSVHNYFPVCSRVNLWKNENGENARNCDRDKNDYADCVTCYQKFKYSSQIMRREAESTGRVCKKMMRMVAKVSEKLCPDFEDEEVYRKFEENTIRSINENMDTILAVSHRVKKIVETHGLDKSKTRVSYIGTKVADYKTDKCAYSPYLETLNVIYMGYMNKQKGFFFFLESLEHMPDELAKKLSVRVVTRYNTQRNQREIERLNNLKGKFNKIELVNGYTPQNQKDLLQEINLGVVPVLWEDNLPQVALEQIAYGIPILVSDLGGAKEIVNDEDFIFKAGSIKDFLDKLSDIQENRELLFDFWKVNRHLVTMPEHIDELIKVYSGK